jgi:Ribonuclease G/E
MVVRQQGDRTQIAVLEDGVLVEHYVTKASAQSYAGNVYLGKVVRVLPGMQAAFVDLGPKVERAAFLYVADVLGSGDERNPADERLHQASAVAASSMPLLGSTLTPGPMVEDSVTRRT